MNGGSPRMVARMQGELGNFGSLRTVDRLRRRISEDDLDGRPVVWQWRISGLGLSPLADFLFFLRFVETSITTTSVIIN